MLDSLIVQHQAKRLFALPSAATTATAPVTPARKPSKTVDDVPYADMTTELSLAAPAN